MEKKRSASPRRSITQTAFSMRISVSVFSPSARGTSPGPSPCLNAALICAFLVMSRDFSIDEVEGRARLLFDRSRAAIVWGICIYWITARTDRTPFLAAWQLRRDGGRRGIVEVQ